jgi:hypothetical protein
VGSGIRKRLATGPGVDLYSGLSKDAVGAIDDLLHICI